MPWPSAAPRSPHRAAAPAPAAATPRTSSGTSRVRQLARSLLTSGDSVGGYRLAGTPDGLGAYDNGDGTFTVLMNHEFAAGVSVPRSHGKTSARSCPLGGGLHHPQVLSGRDQITTLVTTGSPNLDRLCSADLAPVSAWYNAASGLGYDGRLFTNGEESAPNGRAFAHVVDTGVSDELTALGKAGGRTSQATPPPATEPSSSARATVAPRTSTCMPGPSRRPAHRSSGPG